MPSMAARIDRIGRKSPTPGGRASRRLWKFGSSLWWNFREPQSRRLPHRVVRL